MCVSKVANQLARVVDWALTALRIAAYAKQSCGDSFWAPSQTNLRPSVHGAHRFQTERCCTEEGAVAGVRVAA
jgi:hypothetical protein